VRRLADRAVARALDRLEAAAAADLPADVAVAREAGGLRLSGPRLLARWAADGRLHHLVAGAKA